MHLFARYGRLLTPSGLIAAAVLTLSSPSSALDPKKNLRQYVHETYSTEQGLPQATVQALAQTPDGYLWIGTQEGLARFDGVRFVTFDKNNTEAISVGDVRSLAVDSRGVLWIGLTGGGLVSYERGAFKAYGPKDGLVDETVRRLEPSSSHGLLIGTSGGFSVRKDGRFTNFTTKQGLSCDLVNDVLEDRQGRVWIATNKGLSRYENGRVFRDPTTARLDDAVIRSVYQDAKGRLWINAWKEGLYQWVHGELTRFGREQGLDNLMIPWMHEDRDGNFWVATYGGGLHRLESGRFVAYTQADGLTDNNLLVLFEDREGNLWAGTDTAGLSEWRDGKFTSYSVRDGLPEPLVWTIAEDKSGALWLGFAERGFARFAGGRFESFDMNGMPIGYAQGILQDRHGRMWLGAQGGGVLVYEGGRFEKPPALSSLPAGTVKSILEDKDGNLWFAVFERGVFELIETPEGSTLRPFTEDNGLASNEVVFLSLDREGAIWMGAMGKGLTRYRDGKFEVFTEKGGLGHDVVLSFYQDEDGNHWFGTYSGGLMLFRDARFTTITKRDGLFEDTIAVILPDAQGNLWMSSGKGVFKVSRRQLLDFVDGKIQRVAATAYDESDGMRSRDCAGGAQPAGVRARDGRLWFPTTDGITSVDPAHLKLNTTSPPLLLEKLVVDDAQVALGSALRLGPGAGKVEFHYTAPSFISPQKIVFQYKLEGYDTKWIEADTRRAAYYTNLNPGVYRFMAKARNADGVWSKDTQLVAFELVPAFWQTLWFKLVCLLAFALVIIAIARIRLAQVKRQNVILERKVKERTVQLEEAHGRIVQLEKENTEKQMAGGFAHEIRNSLASAKMLLSRMLHPDASREESRSLSLRSSERLLEIFKLVKSKLDPSSVKEMAEMVKEVHEDQKSIEVLSHRAFKSIERSLDVTTTIMDYSKIGASPKDDTPVALDGVIAHVIDDCRHELEALEVTLKLDVTPGLVVRGAQGHFYSVFNNLVQNAKDALADNSRQSVSPRTLRIRSSVADGVVRVAIWDNGVGIKEANLPRIFEPFFSTKPHTGKGLGLGFVTKHLSLYGGALAVTSEEGRFTEFVVTLPEGAGHSINAPPCPA